MKRILLFFILLPVFFYGQSSKVEHVQVLVANKQYQEAEIILKEMLSENEDDVDVQEKLGDVYGHQKKWDDAIFHYRKLKEEYPEAADYHYKFGGALGMKALEVSKLMALMYVDDIKKSFETAVKLDPSHIDAHWALVEFYIQVPGILGGSKRKAIACAEKLENISKVNGYLAKGYVYEYKKEPKLAEQNYRMAISNIEAIQDKEHRNALHYQIGKVSAEYNLDLDKGLSYLEKFIENHSVSDGVPIEWGYLRLAQIYRLKQNREQAGKWIDKALAVRSSFKQAKKERKLIMTL